MVHFYIFLVEQCLSVWIYPLTVCNRLPPEYHKARSQNVINLNICNISSFLHVAMIGDREVGIKTGMVGSTEKNM